MRWFEKEERTGSVLYFALKQNLPFSQREAPGRANLRPFFQVHTIYRTLKPETELRDSLFNSHKMDESQFGLDD